MTAIVGIDPGISGAICLLSESDRITWEMPTYEITVAGKKRKKIDALKLINIINDASPTHIWIEKVGSRPGEGHVGSFSFGFSCGIIEASIISCKIPFTYVLPQEWKNKTKTPKDKNSARLRATQLMPDLSHNWSLKKNHNIAEAALIAYFGKERLLTK